MGGTAGLAGLLGAAVTAGVVALGSPAAADESVTVRGTAFPSPDTAQLSLVGCADLYQRTGEDLRPFISLGRSPTGSRSLGYDLAGGNAVGSLHRVDSMAATTVASLDVRAPEGATGVAYAGYQEPADAGTELVWFGRADLVAPAGGWSTFDAAQFVYTWTKYDMSTSQRVPAAPGSESTMSVSEFMAGHGGDGPGLYTIGFGCDGQPFTMDAMRIRAAGAVTTFDLEGLTTATSIDGSRTRITAGQEVRLTGALRTGAGQRVPHATVVLEQRSAPGQDWRRVDVVSADPEDPSVVVAPLRRTSYRWRFVDRPVAEGSVSATYDVSVAPLVEAAPHGNPVGSVTGRTFPAKPGAVATLWEVDRGVRSVGRAVIGEDGRFSIDVPRGTRGRFVVTTPAGDGHLGGMSAEFVIDAVELTPGPPSATPPADPPTAGPPSSLPTASASASSADASAPAESTAEPTALETAASSLTP